MKTREQAIFDELYKRCRKYGAIYDYKPLENTPYPFIEFERTETNYKPNKTDIKGDVTVNISVWGLLKDRKRVGDIASNIFETAFSINEAFGYSIGLNVSSSSIRFIDDYSTADVLKRAMVELKFNLL